MEFKTAAQQACYEKVAVWMKELFGETIHTRDDRPVFLVPKGSTFASVVVYPWGDDEAIIVTRDCLVTGPELTTELMRYLLEENAGTVFGAFGIDEDGDIIFEHTILGSTCDKAELKHSIRAVLEVADHYDEAIVNRWGGQRAIDRKPS